MRYWWLLGGTIILSLILAFLVIRYSPSIYEVGAKVMIANGADKIDPSSLIYGDQLLGTNEDVVNELIIIKSYPILAKTVKDENQNVHYYRTTTALERTIEIEENNSPFIVEPIGDWVEQQGLSYKEPLHVELDDDGYQIFSEEKAITTKKTFGDSVHLPGKLPLRVRKNINPFAGLQYFFRLQSVEQTVQDYQGRITSELAQQQSSIIALKLEGALVERERSFLQQLLVNYLEANLAEKNQGASNTINFINRELASIKDSLKKIEGRLEAFKSRNQISNLQREGQRIFEKLLELEEEKAQFQLQKKYLSLLNEYLVGEQRTKLVTPSSFGILDPALNGLIQDLIKLETERNLMGEGSESSIAVQLDARLNELRGTLESYVSNLTRTNAIKLDEIMQRIALVEGTIEDLPVSEIALMNIERLHKLSESLYLLLLEKKAEAEITRSSNTPDIKLVEGARILSRTPVRPNKKLIYGGFFLLGLIAPLVWIVLSVYFDRSIRSKEEVTEAVDIPFMGYIASAKDKPLNHVVEQPKSHLSETFRTLRSNLKYMQKSSSAQKVLVSSCFPGEGKTFISVNLALSYASAGKKVILIGADLRKPQVHNYFNLSDDMGLSNLLSGSRALEEVTQSTPHGVDVITSGPIPPNPLELLDSEPFARLLEMASEKYDYVVVDTSPFVLVSDARVLFSKMDINLIVLRSKVSRRDNLELIDTLVNEAGQSSFGVVLNDHDMGSEFGYRYGKGYANGYGYYSEV